MTLRNDLLKSRDPEFQYRAAALKGLYRKARALALQECRRFGPMEGTPELEEPLPEDDVDGYLRAELEQSDLEIRQAREAHNTYYAPGSERFSDAIAKLVLLNSNVHPVDPKFDAVSGEYCGGRSAEWRSAHYRLTRTHDFSLEYTDKDLKALKMPKDIDEPIFRSLASFQLMESAEGMTPEAYRDMVLDLGAGYVEHWDEITKDFANIQVIINMAEKFPGFLDTENNPADQVLLRRIQYYN